MREPIGLDILAEALVGQHSYASFRRYVSYRRYAPVPPMTRTPPPADPSSPAAREPLPKDESDAHIEARRAEFDKRVDPLLPRLDAAALALTRAPEDAKDLRQETVTRAWMYARDKVCELDQENLYAFLLVVMRNCWKTELVKRKSGRVGEPNALYVAHAVAMYGDSAAPQERSEEIDLQEHLSRALARLPPPCRRALELIESGKSYQQTAEMMNEHLHTVSVLFRRAKRLLKKDLEAHGVRPSRNIQPPAKEVSP